MGKQVPTVEVSAKVIRLTAAEGKWEVPEVAKASIFGRTEHGPRGRLHPEGRAAFDAAGLKDAEGRVMVYAGEKTPVSEANVTLDARKPNARGAMLKRPVQVSRADVLRLAGKPTNQRGRLSRETIAAATAAYEAEKGWRKA